MNILHLIVARGGSKGFPGKNLRSIEGVPLITYKARSAMKSEYCTRLILSSDDREIIALAKKEGIDAPFVRPAELATDTCSTEAVALHAMEWIQANDDTKYDAIMILEPTTPFVSAKYYNQAVQLMQEKNAYFVTGLSPVSHPSLWQAPDEAEMGISQIVQQIKSTQGSQRQQCQQEYALNGAFYLLDWDRFLSEKQRYCLPNDSYGIPIPEEYSVNIDTQHDFDFACYLAQSGRIDLSHWQQSAKG